MSGLASSVEMLLLTHGVTAPETPFAGGVGYSGAVFAAVNGPDGPLILKRLRHDADWLMRLTRDTSYREAQFAASRLPACLPAGVAAPTLGASFDGAGRAILMRDIGTWLLDGTDIVPEATVDAVLRGLAELHAAFWGTPPGGAEEVAWCDGVDFLNLLTPRTGVMLMEEGRDFGLLRGWEAFARLAPREGVALVERVRANPAMLRIAMAPLPRTLLHGDAKLANMGIDGQGTLWLIDWAMVACEPVAVELAWFLAVNSSRLPWTADVVLDRYRAHLEPALEGTGTSVRWQEQLALIGVCGLLLYGWGKALDAEAGSPDELRWWCERAAAGARALGW